MTDGQDRPDLLAILRHYYGDVLDNSQNGDMRYLSDALEELIAGRVQAAIKQEREAMLMAAHEAIRRSLTEAGIRNEVLRGMAIEVGLEYFSDAIRARSEDREG